MARKQSGYQTHRNGVFLKRKVRQLFPRQGGLVRRVSLAWESGLTSEYCEKLVMSMPDRIAEVIKNPGDPTKF